MTVYLQDVAVIRQISQQYIADKQHFPTAPIIRTKVMLWGVFDLI